MNTEDSEFKRLEHEALLRASQPEHHPLHTYSVAERLAELHLYEEINEFYAKCNAGAENLRDWVAERMDIEPVQPASQSELQEAFAEGMSCRPASVQRTWVGLTKKEYYTCTDGALDNYDLWAAIETKLKDKNK